MDTGLYINNAKKKKEIEALKEIVYKISKNIELDDEEEDIVKDIIQEKEQTLSLSD